MKTLLTLATSALLFASFTTAPKHVQSGITESYTYYEETDKSSGKTYVIEKKTTIIASLSAKGAHVQESSFTTRTDFTCVPEDSDGFSQRLRKFYTASDDAQRLAEALEVVKTAPRCLAPRQIEAMAERLTNETDRATLRQAALPRCASASCAVPKPIDIEPLFGN